MGLKLWRPQDCISSGGSKDKESPGLFWLLKGTYIPWFMTPFCLQGQIEHHSELCSGYHVSFFDSDSLLSYFPSFEIILG